PQSEQRANDGPERLRIAGGLSGAPVDHELLRALRDLRVEVVEQHPQRRLRRPRARVQLRAARSVDRRQVTAEGVDDSVDRPRGAHRRRCPSRPRRLCQVHSIANMNAPTARTTAQSTRPPVTTATTMTITAKSP